VKKRTHYYFKHTTVLAAILLGLHWLAIVLIDLYRNIRRSMEPSFYRPLVLSDAQPTVSRH